MVLRSHPPLEAGFVLPLSLTGALVLLLSSLSIQSLVLHTRQVQAAERVRLQAEDRLASASQEWAAQLQGPFACLAPVASAEWHTQPLPAACPPDLDPQALQQLEIAGATVQLLSWEPGTTGGVLRLQLAPNGLQRRYGLSRTGIRELG
jgi:hypothetical protein